MSLGEDNLGVSSLAIEDAVFRPAERSRAYRIVPNQGGEGVEIVGRRQKICRHPRWLSQEAECEQLRCSGAISDKEADEMLKLSTGLRADVEKWIRADDKNGINACKLLGVPFTTAIGILVRMREKRRLTTSEALVKLEELAKHGRYKKSILEDARRKLEVTTS